ncbi:MAG: hypothetical protein HY666_02620 [Chloroflexi bacterium]|nr:hypothetical protein [Chloroflexota bacterium]
MVSGQVTAVLTPAGGDISGSGNVVVGERGSIPGLPWSGEGCWLAQPVALYDPDPRLDAYRLPGEYRIKVTVECASGEGDSQEFILVSPDSWEGLQLRRL